MSSSHSGKQPAQPTIKSGMSNSPIIPHMLTGGSPLLAHKPLSMQFIVPAKAFVLGEDSIKFKDPNDPMAQLFRFLNGVSVHWPSGTWVEADNPYATVGPHTKRKCPPDPNLGTKDREIFQSGYFEHEGQSHQKVTVVYELLLSDQHVGDRGLDIPLMELTRDGPLVKGLLVTLLVADPRTRIEESIMTAILQNLQIYAASATQNPSLGSGPPKPAPNGGLITNTGQVIDSFVGAFTSLYTYMAACLVHYPISLDIQPNSNVVATPNTIAAEFVANVYRTGDPGMQIPLQAQLEQESHLPFALISSQPKAADFRLEIFTPEMARSIMEHLGVWRPQLEQRFDEQLGVYRPVVGELTWVVDIRGSHQVPNPFVKLMRLMSQQRQLSDMHQLASFTAPMLRGASFENLVKIMKERGVPHPHLMHSVELRGRARILEVTGYQPGLVDGISACLLEMDFAGNPETLRQLKAPIQAYLGAEAPQIFTPAPVFRGFGLAGNMLLAFTQRLNAHSRIATPPGLFIPMYIMASMGLSSVRQGRCNFCLIGGASTGKSNLLTFLGAIFPFMKNIQAESTTSFRNDSGELYVRVVGELGPEFLKQQVPGGNLYSLQMEYQAAMGDGYLGHRKTEPNRDNVGGGHVVEEMQRSKRILLAGASNHGPDDPSSPMSTRIIFFSAIHAMSPVVQQTMQAQNARPSTPDEQKRDSEIVSWFTHLGHLAGFAHAVLLNVDHGMNPNTSLVHEYWQRIGWRPHLTPRGHQTILNFAASLQVLTGLFALINTPLSPGIITPSQAPPVCAKGLLLQHLTGLSRHMRPSIEVAISTVGYFALRPLLDAQAYLLASHEAIGFHPALVRVAVNHTHPRVAELMAREGTPLQESYVGDSYRELHGTDFIPQSRNYALLRAMVEARALAVAGGWRTLQVPRIKLPKTLELACFRRLYDAAIQGMLEGRERFSGEELGGLSAEQRRKYDRPLDPELIMNLSGHITALQEESRLLGNFTSLDGAVQKIPFATILQGGNHMVDPNYICYPGGVMALIGACVGKEARKLNLEPSEFAHFVTNFAGLFPHHQLPNQTKKPMTLTDLGNLFNPAELGTHPVITSPVIKIINAQAPAERGGQVHINTHFLMANPDYMGFILMEHFADDSIEPGQPFVIPICDPIDPYLPFVVRGVEARHRSGASTQKPTHSPMRARNGPINKGFSVMVPGMGMEQRAGDVRERDPEIIAPGGGDDEQQQTGFRNTFEACNPRFWEVFSNYQEVSRWKGDLAR